jgi:hypothetical protein
MIVLNKLPYDAILGYDWLKANSPMACDWAAKTIQFTHQGRTVTLQGVQTPTDQVQSISAKQLYKSTKGNDVWAYVMVDTATTIETTNNKSTAHIPSDMHDLLTLYADVFQDPQELPPARCYDHAIPLLPDTVLVNSRPYHYSPQHKTEIENQVKQLMDKGLITHSHSPFASHVLLVKKRTATGDSVLTIES